MATVPHPSRTGPALPGDVLITWPDYDEGAAHLGQKLSGAGLRWRLEPKRGARSQADMLGLVGNAAAAIVSTDPFDRTVLEAAPGLRVIARVGVGVDSIDLDAATAAGVAVTVTPGANESAVADHTVALMLAVLRRVCEQDASVRTGGWARTGQHTPWELNGACVGLVGYGRIGQLVARRLSGFDVRLVATDLAPIDDPAVEQVELGELVSTCDVISLHVPLTSATSGVIGVRELESVQPGTVLINTARGGVVDEDALIEALRDGRLRGAGLDVFSLEPPASSALLGMPNVVLSPHNAGLSVRSVDDMLRRATASVVDVLSGRAPADVANPDVLRRLGLDA